MMEGSGRAGDVEAARRPIDTEFHQTMPTYVYQEILDDGAGGDVFEVVQRMADDALTTHPTSGRPVRRLLQPPGLTLKVGSSKASLDDGNLARLGFTKYQKASDGKYEKTVGTGPDLIQRGDD